MTLGEKIRYLRNKRKWSQQELGTLINLSENQIGRYEKDSSFPTSPVIKKLCEVFKVPSDFLLFDKDETSLSTTIDDAELLQQFEEVTKLEENEKSHVKYFLTVVLNNNKLKKMTA